MDFPIEQVEELKKHYKEIRQVDEGGLTYFYIPTLVLPEGCEPRTVEALFCPMTRDGYPSRLFFSAIIKSPFPRNWNANGVRVFERQWYGFSYNYIKDMTLIQMMGAHIRGLKENR